MKTQRQAGIPPVGPAQPLKNAHNLVKGLIYRHLHPVKAFVSQSRDHSYFSFIAVNLASSICRACLSIVQLIKALGRLTLCPSQVYQKQSQTVIYCGRFIRKPGRLIRKCSRLVRNTSRLVWQCGCFMWQCGRLVKLAGCLAKYPGHLVKMTGHGIQYASLLVQWLGRRAYRAGHEPVKPSFIAWFCIEETEHTSVLDIMVVCHYRHSLHFMQPTGEDGLAFGSPPKENAAVIFSTVYPC